MRPDMRPAQAVLLIYVPQGLLLEHLGGSLFKHIYPFQPCDPILDPDPSSLFAHHSIIIWDSQSIPSQRRVVTSTISKPSLTISKRAHKHCWSLGLRLTHTLLVL
jgi:hypothetical protein